jgi:hypothetical protein
MLKILNEWLALLDFNSFIFGLSIGLILALVVAVLAAKAGSRKGA